MTGPASFTLDSPTGAALRVYRVEATRPRGIVFLFHGLAEHAGRYRGIASELAKAGYTTYAHDHRGHGSTCARDAPLRRFADREGMRKVLRDCRAVQEHALLHEATIPRFVFGHSMGGLIALNYAARHPQDLDGLAVWNADFRTGWPIRLARLGLAVEKAMKGSDVASGLFRRAMFDSWSRAIEDRRTGFDWLSHDAAAVDAYVEDPLCGFTPTVSMMRDVVALIETGAKRETLALIPADLPIHLLGGSNDPVTEGGRATTWLAGRLRGSGHRNVSLTIAEGARHETLHEIETIRAPAIAQFVEWLDRIVAERRPSER